VRPTTSTTITTCQRATRDWVVSCGSACARPSKNITTGLCGVRCANAGFPSYGVDRSDDGRRLSCYCGCALNKAAPAVPDATNTSCTASSGTMSAFRMPCANATTCGGGPGRLPAGSACSQASAQRWAFCNRSKPLEERVDDLVARISVAEAGALLTARESPAIPRLGIPAFYWGTNAIHGVTHTPANTTTFANTIGLASTWNRSVYRGVGRVIGRELRALHNLALDGHTAGLTAWAPTINIIRDPRELSLSQTCVSCVVREHAAQPFYSWLCACVAAQNKNTTGWGRVQESASECPYLAGSYGAEFSLGMQYDQTSSTSSSKPTKAVAGELMAVATLKHVLAYSLENWSPDGNYTTKPATYSRGHFDSVVSAYDLEDTFTQPFKHAIIAGGAAGIMWACDKVNGVPPPASTDLRDRLRAWGFNGYRTTDGNGICGMAQPNKRTMSGQSVH
jgi:beta-D-xylosidase 4